MQLAGGRMWLMLGVAAVAGVALSGCAQMPESATAPAPRPARSAEARQVKVIEHHVREDRWHRPIDVDEETFVRRAQPSGADGKSQ